MVKSCDTWDCAASDFNISGGSTDTVVIPTTSTDVKWIVLRRIAGGSATVIDPTFTLESFDDSFSAFLRFSTIDASLKPMIVSAPDGKLVVVMRMAPEQRRRAAAH